MKQFFKFTFASILGIFVSVALIFFISAGIIGALVSSASSKKKVDKVKDNSILVLDFEKAIRDRKSDDPFAHFNFNTLKPINSHTLESVVKGIERAKTDDRIVGIQMDFRYFNGSMANLEEVQKAIIDFKESGKFITAYGENIGQSAYYLYSLADTVALYPLGDLNLLGLSSELTFFKKALDRWDVNVEILRGPNNKYKSAVEPFLYEEMSPESREQMTVLLGDIWSKFGNVIAEQRGLPLERLNTLMDSLHVTNSELAVKEGLIDVMWYEDEFRADLMRRVGAEDMDDVNKISLSKYAANAKDKGDSDGKPWDKKDKIAVVYAEGGIQLGKSGDGAMGSETVVEHLREAREDSTIKGVVFRVNSPGGSALASDIIWREVELTRKEKPVVVSMGALAASGGYYISSSADRIFADESTITGSIGVFGMMFNLGEFMDKHIGITSDYVQTHENAGSMSGVRPLSPYAKEYINNEISKIYTTFKTRVADGRNMSMEEVEAVAKGRVWSGKSALNNGLVDEIGTLEDAKNYLKSHLELEEVEFESIPKEKDPMEILMEGLQEDFASVMFDKFFSTPETVAMKKLKELQERDPIQMRMPMDIVIR